MIRIWTIIGVRDVAASMSFYQRLLGLRLAPPAHEHFGQLLDADGTVLLSLHQWGAHEHPTLTAPSVDSPGNGLILFFRVDDFELALSRARAFIPAFVHALVEEPHVNPNTQTREFSLRDPDGYFVTMSALSPE